MRPNNNTLNKATGRTTALKLLISMESPFEAVVEQSAVIDKAISVV